MLGCCPQGGREPPAAPRRPCPPHPDPEHPSSSRTSSGMGLSGEHGQSRVREEVLAARRMGNQGLPQGTPPGALVPQEHPQPSPRMRTQVRGWEDPAEPWGLEWLQDAHLWVSQGAGSQPGCSGAKKKKCLKCQKCRRSSSRVPSFHQVLQISPGTGATCNSV